MQQLNFKTRFRNKNAKNVKLATSFIFINLPQRILCMNLWMLKKYSSCQHLWTNRFFILNVHIYNYCYEISNYCCVALLTSKWPQYIRNARMHDKKRKVEYKIRIEFYLIKKFKLQNFFTWFFVCCRKIKKTKLTHCRRRIYLRPFRKKDNVNW